MKKEKKAKKKEKKIIDKYIEYEEYKNETDKRHLIDNDYRTLDFKIWL